MKIIDVIKYEGNNDTFVWKHPAEDFNTLSQLIVHESQEAVFFRNGQALDVFGPGRYTLHTQNIPLLNKIINLPSGGESPFHCEVYFVNKTMPLDMKWGTSSQVVVQDPKFNILLHAGANGGMGVQISDAKKFLSRFVGTAHSFEKETLISYFREMIVTHIKTYLTNVMSKVSFVTVNSQLNDMSKAMHEVLNAEIQEFGVNLINFFVSSIQLDKDDYEKIQIALANAGAMGITASAEKSRMDTIGYSWADQEMAQILKTYAANEGAQGNIGGMMAQMPMAFAFGQMMRNNAEPAMNFSFSRKPNAFSNHNTESTSQNDTQFCSNCGKKLDADAKFCSECGKMVSAQKTCGNCGHILKDDDNFCPSCGMKKS